MFQRCVETTLECWFFGCRNAMVTSHLQAAVVLQSAWRRRAAQVRDMPGSIADPEQKKENGTSD